MAFAPLSTSIFVFMNPQLSPRLIAVLDLLGFGAVVTVNALANILPINGLTTGELSDMYPNLFVPAGFTFSIWGLIYLMLLAMVGYRLVSAFRSGGEGAFREVSWLFLLTCVLNVSWILAWHHQLVVLSVLIMLGFLATLAWIYLRLRGDAAQLSGNDRWLVVPVFSVYLGWISIATVANVTTLLVDLGWRGGSLGEEWWTGIMLGVAILLGLVMLWKYRDWVYAGVLVWAFWGIYSKRSASANPEEALIVLLWVGMGLLVAGMAVAGWSRLKAGTRP